MRRDVDYLFEQWALWVRNGCYESRGFSSMLEMMMVTRCQFTGGGGPVNDSVQTSIEGAVALLSLSDETAAVVVRIEYGAWEIRGLDLNAPQITKAHALSLTLRQYRRKLAKARSFVIDYLKESRK